MASVTEKLHPTFEDLELLVELSQLLTLHNLSEVMERVMHLTADAVGAKKASLFLLDGVLVDWNYVFTARNLKGADSVRVISKVLDQGLAGWVVRNQQTGIVDDAGADDRWHVFPEDDMVVGSAMCVPLIYDGQVIAVLTLVHPSKHHFNDYHQRLMTIVANQATVAIRNTQLFQRLLEKQQQLEAVLKSVPDVLLVLDDTGRLVLINDGAKTLLERIAIEVSVGQPLDAYAAQFDAFQDILYRINAGQVQADENISFETHLPAGERDFAVTISAWEDATNERRGYVVIMHDITTMRDLFRFKDEMLRIVSHDLRSPLSIISGYTDMIEYDIESDSHLFEFTDAIKRSIKRMSDLLEALLQVRKIDETGLNVEEGVVMLDIVRPVIQGAVMLAYQKDQILLDEVEIDESVRGDVDQTLLRQAMDNLASNAIKYTPEGGRITLRGYVKDDGSFCFEVEDDGIGIPEGSIPHLFEPFYRVYPDQNTSISGVGLGLSLVKSIVERHRGNLWVGSKEGIGSTFGMCIPLQR